MVKHNYAYYAVNLLHRCNVCQKKKKIKSDSSQENTQ